MTNAFSGKAAGGLSFCGVAELHDDAPRAAPPITADIEAATMARREIVPGPWVFSPPQAHSTPVRLADIAFAGTTKSQSGSFAVHARRSCGERACLLYDTPRDAGILRTLAVNQRGVDVYPGFTLYRRRTQREIPVLAFDPAD